MDLDLTGHKSSIQLHESDEIQNESYENEDILRQW